MWTPEPLLYTRLTPGTGETPDLLFPAFQSLQSAAARGAWTPASPDYRNFWIDRADDGVSVILSGISEEQLAHIVAHVRATKSMRFSASPFNVSFREIVRSQGTGGGRIQKDIGSKRITASCSVSIKPLLGDGPPTIALTGSVVGLPEGLKSALITGIEEATREGDLVGRPMMSLAVEVDKADLAPPDAEQTLLRMAAKAAMKSAFRRSSPYLVEPIMEVEVIAPDRLMGDIIGDLNSRRARILAMGDHEDGRKAIRCTVPLGEMVGYGRWLMTLPVPNNLSERLPDNGISYRSRFEHWGEVPVTAFKAITDPHRSDDPPEASAGRPVRPLRPKPGVPGGQKKPYPPES